MKKYFLLLLCIHALCILPVQIRAVISSNLEKAKKAISIDRIVAIVNNDVVTQSELNKQMKIAEEQMINQGIKTIAPFISRHPRFHEKLNSFGIALDYAFQERAPIIRNASFRQYFFGLRFRG